MKLEISQTPKSLNELFRYHWRKLDKYRREVLDDVGWEIKEQKLKPISGPVRLEVEIHFDNRQRHDYDNYIGGLKFFLDAVKEMGILPDDNSEIIQEIKVKFKVGKERKTVINFYGV